MRPDRAPTLAPDAPAIQPEPRAARSSRPPSDTGPAPGRWGRPDQLVSKEASDNPSIHKPPLLTNDSQSRRPAPPPQNQSLPPSWPCGDLREAPPFPWGCPQALPSPPSRLCWSGLSLQASFPFLFLPPVNHEPSQALTPAPRCQASGGSCHNPTLAEGQTLLLPIPDLSCEKGVPGRPRRGAPRRWGAWAGGQGNSF